MSAKLDLSPEERVLFIINDNTINGTTRFQKYGFLLYKQYQRELAELKISFSGSDFYNDWEPYHYGPYSNELKKDIDVCIDKKILSADKPGNRKYLQYKLALKGRKKWRSMFNHAPDEMITINNKIRYLQLTKTIDLLSQIYTAYPEYTVKSRIKESLG